MTPPILIVGYGVGNLGAIPNMLARIGATAEITADPDRINRAAKIILPGVGAFDAAMGRLQALDLVGTLGDRARAGVPILGLCLGMQLLANGSEEGLLPGLGWIPGRVVRFRPAEMQGQAIPHMGWSYVDHTGNLDLLAGMGERPRFYFAHTYHFLADEPADVKATAAYGYSFPAIVGRDNVTGVQFHPEKSHRFGLKLLENFVGV